MKVSLGFCWTLLGVTHAITCPADPGVNGYASVGSGTTGGGSATAVTVTTAADLKSHAGASGSKVIIVKGTITTDGAIDIANDTTIKGYDSSATIIGGFSMNGVSNIIIKNLNIQGGSAVDTIASRNSDHVWYDHLALSDASDGLLDITIQSDYQTVSWCRFFYTDESNDHRLASLVGAGGGTQPDDEGKLHLTYHHNWWSSLVVERMPRVMYGQAHIYNNQFRAGSNDYCVGFGSYASVLLHNNYFQEVNDPHLFMYDAYAWSGGSGNLYDDTTGNRDLGYFGSEDVDGQEGFTYGPFTPPYSYALDDGYDVPALAQGCAGPL
jgi:pectate lyase